MLATGYTAAPEDGSTLTGAQHNTSVTITHMASEKTTTTYSLTVYAPPSASNVTILGTAAVDEELEGRFDYDDDNGDAPGPHTYRWLANGVTFEGATSSTYVLTTFETGKTIQFEVTPVAAEGNVETRTGSPVISSATLPVAASAISSASVNIVTPVLGVTPDTLSNVEANTANEDYTVTDITWNEALTAAGKSSGHHLYSDSHLDIQD